MNREIKHGTTNVQEIDRKTNMVREADHGTDDDRLRNGISTLLYELDIQTWD